MQKHSGIVYSLLSVFIILIAGNVCAQQSVPVLFSDSSKNSYPVVVPNICGNVILLEQLRKDPEFVSREEKMNREILNASRNMNSDTIITLPVVVHIINQTPASISDLQVINGIAELNDAFSKTGIYSSSAGVDTKIRFCLAQKDPDNGITTGITRTKSFFSNDMNSEIEDVRLKNLIQWDPARYINIWLVTNIKGWTYEFFSCGVWYRYGIGGYATMPPGGGPLDGIVITGFTVKLVHEMGHYLGLYDTYQGGCYNNNCQINGDRVCDTPPVAAFSFLPGTCGNPSNTCNTDTMSNYSNGNFFSNVPDQTDNFMDDRSPTCNNRFTQGQKDRMRNAINTQRFGLLQDECTKPCPENIVANFIRDNPYPLPGDLVNFTNTSTGGASFVWLIDGATVSTSFNFSHTFSAIGKYKVTLKVYNSSSCFASYSDFIIVTCGVTARFFTSNKVIASKSPIHIDSIVFTNTSINAQTYQWLMRNNQGMTETLVSTSANLTYRFLTPAIYQVRLIASNGACSDTTGLYTIIVHDPTPDGIPFRISVYCYQQNKILVSFCISNSGYFLPIPAGTPVNFYDKNPSLPTANKLSPTFYTPRIPGGYCYMCFTHILNVPYRGIEKIYLVFNDSGNVIPVSLPNTNLIELNYNNNIDSSRSNRTNIYQSICQGSSYQGYSTAGTYIDTLASLVNGCDSIRTLILTVKPVYNTTVTASICQGQNYAGHTTSGTFVDVYTAANSCDSTRTLNLTVKPVFFTTVDITICYGQNYYGHTTTGTYTDLYTASNGCDSTRTVDLTVLPVSFSTLSVSICQGQNYAGHTTSGTYVDMYTAANGCDSTRTLFLTVNPVFNTTVNASICQGQNYAGHTTAGTYVDVYTAANGCDSTRTLNLTIKTVFETTVNTSICQGQNYAGHTTAGTYVDVYIASNGCDSTRTLHLTVKPTVSTNVIETICEGENYAGHIFAGTYIDVYTAINGCDSTRTLQLIVNPKKITSINKAICKGESHFAAGHFQTSTGVYSDTLRTYQSCDSIIITNLTVNELPSPNLGPDRGVCKGKMLTLNPGNFSDYLWQDGSTGSTFTTNITGTYSVTVTNISGCKASATMKLYETYSLPVNFLPSDSSLCRGNNLEVRVRGYKNYYWSTGSDNNYINVSNPGIYRLRVIDKNDCEGIDSIRVLFYECLNIQVPSGFTPNKDGKNEVFRPFIPAPVTNYHMQIWNRWGQKVFETDIYTKGWDGTFRSVDQPPGVFVYMISLTDIDRKNVNKKGTFVLIR